MENNKVNYKIKTVEQKEKMKMDVKPKQEKYPAENYLILDEAGFSLAISKAIAENNKLISLFCVQDFQGMFFTLIYVFEQPSKDNLIILLRKITQNSATSISKEFPCASWFEREVSDGFGIDFMDSFDKRRLFLHEIYPDGFHPLLKSFKNSPLELKFLPVPEVEYKFKEMAGEGVYQIPVGPVHAGIIEPGHFRFSVIGENIFNLEIRMFYKHRGIEKITEGKKPEECVKYAESISGDESCANAVGFCSCVEKISSIIIPERASILRTILLEMERSYALLGDLAGMAVDVGYYYGSSRLFALREELFRKNDELSNSRFLKGIVSIGGLKKDIAQDSLEKLNKFMFSFSKNFSSNIRMILRQSSVIDRFENTGIIRKDLVYPMNLSGPIARASGVLIDTRLDHPYLSYPLLGIERKSLEKGDVLSRFEIKSKEVLESASLIQQLIKLVKPGKILSDYKIKDGFSISLIESPRGQNLHFAFIKDGMISRYKAQTASFCNWQSIEHAVLGEIVPDFPLVNKSLNLSYSGTDL